MPTPRKLVTHIAAYLRALGGHWRDFVITGTSVTFVFGIAPILFDWWHPKALHWVLFALIGVLVAGFQAWRDLYRVAGARLRFQIDRHQPHGREVTWRLRVLSEGNEPARNVVFQLFGIAPRPRAGNFRGQFPCRLAGPMTLNPEQTDVVEVAVTWVSGNDDRRIITGLDGMVGPNLNNPNALQMDDDEMWNVFIHVTGENTEAKVVTIWVQPLADHLVELILPPEP